MTGNKDDNFNKKRGQKRLQTSDRNLKRKREVEDIELLSQHVLALDPKPTTPLTSFSDLPLSQATISGLESAHFKSLTLIQAQAIPVSLQGKDILGSAKTGSGKTLAFVVPVLENLYRRRWTEYDGLGALILSPTRELATQIFDVLRKVGRNHTFSAGLVIGGKSLQEERDRLGRMNILVATPGRMLQHMDQNAELDIGNLQMLVLDEADRIMDMGFQSTVDAIVDHLPKQRQTMLFSATQTKKISDLARLSLHDPEFISVHGEAETATPSQLAQNYVVTPLAQKLDTLWSFLRSNTKKKTLVFLSSGKQVRFVYEAFRHLQPGVPLLHLHGRQKQSARLDITTKFSNSKHVCLFSTDVAARGLDFPAVDWVIQVDCPEDTETYIHRVGRTARYKSAGHAVLFVDPSESEGMLKALERGKITGVEEIHVRQKKMQSTIQNQLQNMCFKDPELKYLGQKAFVSYVRSIFVQKDKQIFDVKKLDLEAFAASLGLPGAPRVKFVKGEDVKRVKNMPRALAAMEQGSDTDSDDVDGEKPERKSKTEAEKPVRTKYDRMFERRNQDVLSEHYAKLIDDGQAGKSVDPHTADADSDDEFMAVKARYEVDDARLGLNSNGQPPRLEISDNSDDGNDNDSDDDKVSDPTKSTIGSMQMRKTVHLSKNPSEPALIIDSNRRMKLLKSKKALLKYKGHGSHVVFDGSDEDDNEGHEKVYYVDEAAFERNGSAEMQRATFVEAEKEKTRQEDEVDRRVAKEKRREKKNKRKERERMAGADVSGDDDEDMGVQLIPYKEDILPLEEQANDEELIEKPKDKQKRKRKWFEDPDSDENKGDVHGKGKMDKKPNGRNSAKKHNRRHMDELDEGGEPQTLENLEALASGLLNQ